MFDDRLMREAERLLADLRRQHLKLATAESCTGGLLAALLTDVPDSSDVIERGFVTYSIAAKIEMLGVPASMITAVGAVSREVAVAMAEGALLRSAADVSVAVTGLAGPGGGTVLKPIGLVHIAAAKRGAATVHRECRFGAIGRSPIRERTVEVALQLVRQAMGLPA